MKKTILALGITTLLCGTFLWAAVIGADTVLTVKNKGYVQVKGFAKQKITSDLGIFKVKILAKNADLKLAYDKLAKDREAIKEFFSDYDFSDKEIGISPVSISEKFKVNEKGYDTPELDHVIVSQSFKVQSKDVQEVQKMASKVGDLMGRSIEARAYDPEYIYTDLENLKLEMIGKSTANATERAKVLAKNGKFKLGNIADVRVGVFQITPEFSTEVSSWGINDTDHINKEIKSVVEVKYFVK